MSSSSQQGILKKLLLRNAKNSRLISAWIALCVGCILLLVSVMIWSSLHELLQGKDSLGSTFLTISKKVGDASMADKKSITIKASDLEEVRKAPQVQDAGLLTPANFQVSASLRSGQTAFSTLLFLEAAPDRFMDQMPERWKWQEGDNTIPIILSRDFLNMYNYIFAPSQGLPLLSEQAVMSLGFTLTIGEGLTQIDYHAQVEGFSDRISSVLVPQSFIDYGNRQFITGESGKASRIIIKVADPSDEAFTSFLKQNNYTTNSEQLRFSKMRSIAAVISGATGVLALLIMAISVLVFILFIELTMAKAQASVQLLLQIGYSPRKLSRFLIARYTPIMLSAVLVAVFVVVCLQYFVAQKLTDLQLQITPFPGMYVWIAAGISAVILLLQISTAIRKAIKQ